MHLRDEELEQYARGRLPESAVQVFECHLLVCHRCQDRMAEMDVFVAAMHRDGTLMCRTLPRLRRSPLHHDDIEHPPPIPSAEPADAPTIDAITQRGCAAQPEEFCFDHIAAATG